MKGLVVELREQNNSFYDDKNKKMILSKNDYLEFIQIAKKAEALDEILRNLIFSCGKCNAFIVKTLSLHKATEKVLLLIMDKENTDEYEDCWGSVFDSFWELSEHLVESFPMTNEEWAKYQTHGLKDVNFMYYDGELATDENGNPLIYSSDEVAFEFDKGCECNRVIKRFYENTEEKGT